MSVDDRLRSAFGEMDESWDQLADEALREVRRRHARGVLLRRAAVAGAVAAAVGAGVVLVGTDRLGGESAPDPVGPPTTPARVDEPPPASSPTVLEGRWRTALLDEDDLRTAALGGRPLPMINQMNVPLTTRMVLQPEFVVLHFQYKLLIYNDAV